MRNATGQLLVPQVQTPPIVGWIPAIVVEASKNYMACSQVHVCADIQLILMRWKSYSTPANRRPSGHGHCDDNCREGCIWSFRKAFAILRAEPGDLASFECDLKDKNVLVRIGGPDLFDAMENTHVNQEEPDTDSPLRSEGIQPETNMPGDTQYKNRRGRHSASFRFVFIQEIFPLACETYTVRLSNGQEFKVRRIQSRIIRDQLLRL